MAEAWAEAAIKKLSAILLPLLLIIGVYDYFTNFEDNNCNMTYMYELPQYVPISLNVDVARKFPWYRLYAYGEGRYADNLRDKNFFGIPVLFIPGNAGSYKQVRSLGSVAYRMSVDYSFYFNYFSADLNEEYSALYGSHLKTQTNFIHECIKKILKLYQPTSRYSAPCSVILVGHSMGGIVARALFTLPDFDSTSVNVIFTQASPHQPIAYFDVYLNEMYENVNKFWLAERRATLKHVNFVSIGGGHRDVMVRSSLTSLSENNSDDMDLFRLTSAIPRVWLSTDHNGIVWCKQLVMTTQRAMFDLVDHQSRQLHVDPSKRASILNYHFVRKTNQLSFDAASRLNSTVLINPKGTWTVKRKSSWSYVQSKVTSLTYFAIPIRRDGNLIVIAKHVPVHDWFIICRVKNESDDASMCTQGKVISRVQLLPSADGDKKFVLLRLTDWRAFTHALVQVQPSVNQVEVFSEVYDPAERHISLTVPHMPYNLFFTSLKVDRTAWNSVFYNISLSQFNALWQAYAVKVIPLTKKCKNILVSVIRFHVPWSNEDVFTYINSQNVTKTVIKLQSSKPYRYGGDPQLHFFLDPRCSYRISISASLPDILGQIMRFYSSTLLVLSVTVLIDALAAQLAAHSPHSKCASLTNTLSAQRLLYIVIIPSYIVLHLLSRFDEVVELIEFLPRINDFPPELRNLHNSFFFCFLFIFALIFVQLLARIFAIPVFLIGRFSSFVLYQYFKRDPGHLKSRPQFPLGATVFSASLFSCAYTFCGSPVLLLGFALYVIKVGYLNGKLNAAENRGRDVTRLRVCANTHFTLMLLWFLSCVLSVPSLLAWIKNLKYDIHLDPDNSLPVTAVLTASLSFLWDEEGPRIRRRVCLLVVWLLRISSVVVVCFALNSIYLLVHFISFAFIAIDIIYAFCLGVEKQD